MKKILFVVLVFGAFTLHAQTVLTLQDCLDAAKEYELSIKNAKLDVLSASARKSEAMSLWFPSISLGAGGFYALNPILNVGLEDVLGQTASAKDMANALRIAGDVAGINTSWGLMDYGYAAGATLKQPLYAGGRIANGNRLASLGKEASMLKLSMSQRESKEKIEEKYWLVVSLQEKQGTLNQAVEMLLSIRRDAVNAFNAGIVLDTDTLRVRREMNNVLIQKTKLRSGLRLAKMDLFNAIGFSYTTVRGNALPERPYLDDVTLAGDMDMVSSPENYYVDAASAALTTEESRLLDMNVKSATLQKKMARGEALPEVGIGAGYGFYRIFGSPSFNGAVMATVKIPITDWWKTAEKMKRYSNDIKKAQNEQEYLDSQLVLKIEALWEELNSAWQQLSVARENVEMDYLTLSRTRVLYESGQATISELLETQTALRQSQSAEVDAQIGYSTALNKYLLMTQTR